jgi:hypothetical protein
MSSRDFDRRCPAAGLGAPKIIAPSLGGCLPAAAFAKLHAAELRMVIVVKF